MISQQAQLSGRVVFTYPNPKGGIKEREITVRELQYGTTKYHKEPTWLLHGYCHTKNAPRAFDLTQVSGLKSVPVKQTIGDLAEQAGIPYQAFASQVMSATIIIAKAQMEQSGEEEFSIDMESGNNVVRLTVKDIDVDKTKH